MARNALAWAAVGLFLLASCTTSAPSRPAPAGPTGTATPAAAIAAAIPAVTLLYPKADTVVEMGQQVSFIVEVTGSQGDQAPAPEVTLALRRSDGTPLATVPATAGADGVYRGRWPVPHRIGEGPVTVTAEAKTPAAVARAAVTFKIKNSTGEDLLQKYGFWLDAPTFKGIVPQLYGEWGNAADGMILWGGANVGTHVYPSVNVQLYWRKGDFRLGDAAAVRRFMLGELGNLGFTPIREIGPFEPVGFEGWPAWKVGGRGQYVQDQVQWLIFYAPEMDETYTIGTAVVLPPPGSDPHAALRQSFEVHPELHAVGVAPAPLVRLLPAPELIAPPLGAEFTGLAQPIILKWQPVKAQLAPDEYYEVAADYNYGEANSRVTYAVRDTQFILPADLYHTPSCRVYNWNVTLKRQTGAQDGKPVGEAVSYTSLYHYLWWRYPTGEGTMVTCPNAQY